MHYMGWIHDGPDENGWAADTLTRYDVWKMKYLWYALALAGIVMIVFALIDVFSKKNHSFS